MLAINITYELNPEQAELDAHRAVPLTCGFACSGLRVCTGDSRDPLQHDPGSGRNEAQTQVGVSVR